MEHPHVDAAEKKGLGEDADTFFKAPGKAAEPGIVLLRRLLCIPESEDAHIMPIHQPSSPPLYDRVDLS